MDVPPPKKITLFIDTPVYSTKNDSKVPSTTLPPQEVKVLQAEKQWFYSNNKNEKKWLYIHTADYGDKWVHLPVERIGYIKPVDYYFYYAYQDLLNDPNYSGPYASMAGPIFASLLNETVHVIGEFVNVYNTRYQVETSYGPKIVLDKGDPALIVNEEINLKSDTPLFVYPLGLPSFLVLHPQTLTSFEKFADSYMYHVHTALGDAWVNPDYSEPIDATKTTESLELIGRHKLYQFPNLRFELNGLSLNSGTIHPTSFWTDSNGTTWYLLETKDGKVWLNLNPVQY